MSDLDLEVISNGSLELTFLPQVGGRLISLRLQGEELLWQNPAYLTDDLTPVTPRSTWPRSDGTMASWANVGGNKSWPAPQGWSGEGEWPGPPDDVLDAGEYLVDRTVTQDGSSCVTLTSAFDRRTGLRISRQFLLPPSGTSFGQTTRFTNESDVVVCWSVWEVTQVQTRQQGVFVVDGTGEPVRMLDVVGVPSWRSTPQGVEVPVQDVVAKLGFPFAEGTVSWLRDDGVRLSQTVSREPDAVYPDGGCPVELWLQHPIAEALPEFGGLHPDAHLVEMEVLSPLTTLAPGESVTLAVTWQLSSSG